ncbi:MAG: GWxTD domain-containing protein [bacterium]
MKRFSIVFSVFNTFSFLVGMFFILNLMTSVQSLAQFRHSNDKMNYYNLGKKLYTEVHYLPGESEDSLIALTFFRFTYDLISFEKSGILNSSINHFYSIPKLEVEFKDAEGIIRRRELWQDTIFTDDFEKTISKSDFIYGVLESKLAYNNYDADIRLSDKNIQIIRKVTIKDTIKNYYTKPTIGYPIFVEISKDDNQKYIPFILKNKIEFSSKIPGFLIPVSYKNEFSKFNYSCKFIGPNKKNEFKWKSDFNVNSILIPENNSVISINKKDINAVELTTKQMRNLDAMKPDENHGNNSDNRITSASKLSAGLLQIALPIEEIVPGEYELKIFETENTDTLTYTFEVVWEDMPFILQKPKFAIESMYYILTDEEYKKMLDADDEDYSKEIINYWKKEDPSKFTPYNESMAEYFKRVDYAIFNFRTLNEANGLKTDRGKVYILYGPATSTDRNLTENKALEVWKYEHLKKMFIFETLANDVFKLIDIKEY